MSTGNAETESHGTRELKGGGELVPHPAQTHGWRNRLSTGNAGIPRKWSGPQACSAVRGRFQKS